jgi:hypothetical protein
MDRRFSGDTHAMKFAANPLPGMNPWVEAYWGDIHTRLTTYSCDAIQRQLPADLQTRVEEYLSVCEPDEESRKLRRISPDVQIVDLKANRRRQQRCQEPFCHLCVPLPSFSENGS